MSPAWLNRLGMFGIAGIGLLLFTLSFALSTLAPALEERQRLTAEAAKLSAALPSATQRQKPGQPDAITPAKLPPLSSADALWQKLGAAAEHAGLPLLQASYRLTDTDNGNPRYEVAFPLKGGYPAIRGFLKEALALSPYATLDTFTLHRAGATDPTVEVEIRLSYYFAAP